MRGRVCRLQLLLAVASAVVLGSKSRGTHDHILLSQIRGPPNLEDQISVFLSIRNRVAQLHLQALGPLFVASYNLQGYAGGIRILLHVRETLHLLNYLTYNISARTAQKTPLLCCSIIVAMELFCPFLLSEPLLSNGCFIAAYFVVAA
jgi:hypothetical protein